METTIIEHLPIILLGTLIFIMAPLLHIPKIRAFLKLRTGKFFLVVTEHIGLVLSLMVGMYVVGEIYDEPKRQEQVIQYEKQTQEIRKLSEALTTMNHTLTLLTVGLETVKQENDRSRWGLKGVENSVNFEKVFGLGNSEIKEIHLHVTYFENAKHRLDFARKKLDEDETVTLFFLILDNASEVALRRAIIVDSETNGESYLQSMKTFRTLLIALQRDYPEQVVIKQTQRLVGPTFLTISKIDGEPLYAYDSKYLLESTTRDHVNMMWENSGSSPHILNIYRKMQHEWRSTIESDIRMSAIPAPKWEQVLADKPVDAES